MPYVPLDPDRVMLAFCLPLRVLLLLCSVAIVAGTARAQDDHYVGSDVCASCHRDIAASQAQTKMAQTWRGSSIAFPESRFDEGTPSSEQIHYEFQRKGNQTLFSATKGGSAPWTAPVESMIGGKRHGISFLLTLDRINGLPLERPAMLEARYALLPTGALVLSPGFPKERPQDLEHELGRVLSPTFELRCLTCHGKPGTLGAGKEEAFVARAATDRGPHMLHRREVRASIISKSSTPGASKALPPLWSAPNATTVSNPRLTQTRCPKTCLCPARFRLFVIRSASFKAESS